ncbi:hypothetical protein DFH09DRAFT_1096178 [Mycena vulgaris]|nr:hypothetical protein DFH09DRAFT_1096178 [Mycena vulgaris]
MIAAAVPAISRRGLGSLRVELCAVGSQAVFCLVHGGFEVSREMGTCNIPTAMARLTGDREVGASHTYRDVERAGGPAWQGASSGTRHRPVLTRGITNAVLHQDRHAGDLGIPSNHQATTPPPMSPAGSQQSRRHRLLLRRSTTPLAARARRRPPCSTSSTSLTPLSFAGLNDPDADALVLWAMPRGHLRRRRRRHHGAMGRLWRRRRADAEFDAIPTLMMRHQQPPGTHQRRGRCRRRHGAMGRLWRRRRADAEFDAITTLIMRHQQPPGTHQRRGRWLGRVWQLPGSGGTDTRTHRLLLAAYYIRRRKLAGEEGLSLIKCH